MTKSKYKISPNLTRRQNAIFRGINCYFYLKDLFTWFEISKKALEIYPAVFTLLWKLYLFSLLQTYESVPGIFCRILYLFHRNSFLLFPIFATIKLVENYKNTNCFQLLHSSVATIFWHTFQKND